MNTHASNTAGYSLKIRSNAAASVAYGAGCAINTPLFALGFEPLRLDTSGAAGKTPHITLVSLETQCIFCSAKQLVPYCKTCSGRPWTIFLCELFSGVWIEQTTGKTTVESAAASPQRGCATALNFNRD